MRLTARLRLPAPPRSGEPAPPAPPPAAPVTLASTPARKRRSRRRVRRTLSKIHRWASFATGIALLVVVLSGVALVYAPEIDKALAPELYRATPTDTPIPPERAVQIVREELPDFGPADVILNRGVYEVMDADYLKQAHVDPGTGRLLGVGTHDGGVMGFLANLHMCALSCEGSPGYLPWLAAPVPWLGSDVAVIGNDGLTWGGLILGAMGLVLLLLCVSGIVIWWPGLRDWARGWKVRRGKGRYATNYDLHKVVGMAAIPFLLMWAITGAGFEFRQVGQVWYALLPGSAPAETEEVFESTPVKGRTVSMAEARAIAAETLPGARMTSISVPDRSDPASAYHVWMADGIDPYAYGTWPGATEVTVDRYSGKAEVTYGEPGAPLSRVLWENWNYPVHAGVPVNGWWRTIWLVVGLSPLLLAITGVATWVMRRRMRGRKRGGGTGPPAAAA
jgi:uncharacterized iron-regulated membrane protein